jgi:hypothetical protein
MTINMDNFVSELENYEFGVKHIIPATSQPLDDGESSFTDELDNILHTRTYLERELRLYPQEQQLLAYLPRLEAADNILRAKREIVLKLVPDFARGRARLRQTPPETYWWWYLDAPILTEVEEQIVYISQDRLGLTFTEAIVAGVGLRAGQSVKVTAADPKHILISIQE